MQTIISPKHIHIIFFRHLPPPFQNSVPLASSFSILVACTYSSSLVVFTTLLAIYSLSLSFSSLRTLDTFVRLKLTTHKTSNILLIFQSRQKCAQFQQFFIRGIIKPGFNGNPIIDLISKGVRRIIHKDSFG